MPAISGKGLHTSTLYVANLECDHEVSFSIGEPTTGDTIWCVRCFDYRMVRHIAEKWGVKCNHCSYARNYGGKLSAETKGTAHSIRFLGHEVEIHGPDNYTKVYRHEPQFLDMDIAPF